MSPKRSMRSLTAGALSLSLLAAVLSMPAAVLAALPNWEVVSVQQLPATVSPGENAGYAVTVRNNGPSNISQLYFYAHEAPAPTFSASSQGSCTNPEGTLFCSLGALRAGRQATIVTAFPTPDDGSTSFTVNFFFNTTGLGSGGSDSSHGDELPATGTTALDDDPNFAGGVSTEPGAVAANAAFTATNQVSTSLQAPAGKENLVLTVGDESGLSTDPACPAQFAPCKLFTSELHLGDGSAQYGLSKAVIEFHKSALSAVNFKKLTVVHVHDDGFAHEIVSANSCNGSKECATFKSLPGGHGRVTIYLAQNGWVKYH